MNILSSFADVAAIDRELTFLHEIAIESDVKLPKYMVDEVVRSYHNMTLSFGSPMFQATDALSAWLTKNLGIHTDSPVFALGSDHTGQAKTLAKFDWRLQQWGVY